MIFKKRMSEMKPMTDSPVCPTEIKLNPCKACGREPEAKFTPLHGGLSLRIRCPVCPGTMGFTWYGSSVDEIGEAYHKWNAYRGRWPNE